MINESLVYAFHDNERLVLMSVTDLPMLNGKHAADALTLTYLWLTGDIVSMSSLQSFMSTGNVMNGTNTRKRIQI